MKIRERNYLKAAVLLFASSFLAAASAPQSQDDYRELFRDGMRRRDMGNWREALLFFDEALKREPDEGERIKLYGRRRFPHYLPRFYAGEALFKIGEYSKALEMWEDYTPGRAYAGVLPEEQRKSLEGYREEFQTKLFPSAFETFAGELLVTRASLKSLENYSDRVGPERWRELESRVKPQEECQGSGDEDGSRIAELARCLEEAERKLADSSAKGDYALARYAREALAPIALDLIALRKEAESSAIDAAKAPGAGAVEEMIRVVHTSPGCPKNAIAALEKVLADGGPADSGSPDLAEGARLALVSGYVKCHDLMAAQRYAGAGDDPRSIARAAATETAPIPVPEPLYPERHALVVGISKYRFWQPLPGVESDIQEVQKVLKERGFEVEVLSDPTRDELKDAIEEFLSEKGRKADTQLLFYYAGHGQVAENQKTPLSFMVPIEAPPFDQRDPATFMKSAVSFGWLTGEIETLRARHALFVFDSCFAGTIFDRAQALLTVLEDGPPLDSASDPRGVTIPGSPSGPPPLIAAYLGSPVRYFLTSGAATQTVPDRSVFRKAFVDGLRGHASHQLSDILSADELAFFVETEVRSRSTQIPMYGPLLLPRRLSTGRILFRVPVRTAAIQGGRRIGD